MRKVGSLLCALLGVGAFVACGSSQHGYDPNEDPNHAGGDPGNGTGSGGDGGGFGSTDAKASLDPDAACAKDTQHATQTPLDLYIILDTSGSMAELTTTGPTKYEAVRGALNAFLADKGSDGIGVGLQYFPQPKPGVPATCTADAQCGAGSPCLLKACKSNIPFIGTDPTPCGSDFDCDIFSSCKPLGQCVNDKNFFCFPGGPDCDNGAGACGPITGSICLAADSCDSAVYAKPNVAIGTLPGVAGAINASLAGKKPSGGTPTAAALQGAVDQARQYAGANAGHAVMTVLITDGLPGDFDPKCSTDINAVANVARSAASGTPSIKTFVIGVFTPDEQSAAQNNLNQVASAGGTTSALVITTNQNVEQQFLQALTKLRGSALPCEFSLPQPKSGTPDYTKVNVQYASGSAPGTLLPNVSDSGACSGSGGWYYNVAPSSGTPTKIELCPTSCDALKKDANATVDVIQGCTTIK
jgi:von Willebrand factor type A domain